MTQEALDAVQAAGAKNVQTIELDCAPGFTRPGAYINGVLKDTGVEAGETVSRFFGCWTWEFPNVTPERWAEIKKITGPRIRQLHKSGCIRYGSW